MIGCHGFFTLPRQEHAGAELEAQQLDLRWKRCKASARYLAPAQADVLQPCCSGQPGNACAQQVASAAWQAERRRA